MICTILADFTHQYLQSYHERDAFIATQGPKQNTIGDFWRMIFEKEVTNIVMLTPLVDRGRVSFSFISLSFSFTSYRIT